MMKNGRRTLIPPEDRDLILARIGSGTTLREIAATYGVSRQGVSLYLRRHASEPEITGTLERGRKIRTGTNRERRNRAQWKELERRVARGKRCVMCGDMNLRGDKVETCTSRCSKAYKIIRRYLSDEEYQSQRVRAAQWIVNTAETREASADRMARHPEYFANIHETEPNRRYIWSEKVRALLAEYRPEILNQLGGGTDEEIPADRSNGEHTGDTGTIPGP